MAPLLRRPKGQSGSFAANSAQTTIIREGGQGNELVSKVSLGTRRVGSGACRGRHSTRGEIVQDHASGNMAQQPTPASIADQFSVNRGTRIKMRLQLYINDLQFSQGETLECLAFVYRKPTKVWWKTLWNWKEASSYWLSCAWEAKSTCCPCKWSDTEPSNIIWRLLAVFLLSVFWVTWLVCLWASCKKWIYVSRFSSALLANKAVRSEVGRAEKFWHGCYQFLRN